MMMAMMEIMEMMMTMMEENNKNNNSTESLPTKRISLVKISVLSISKNKALIESFIEDVLNRHDLSAIENYSNPIAAKRGGSFKQFLSAFFTAFPDWHTKHRTCSCRGYPCSSIP